MGQSDVVDQQCLMTCYLQAVRGALPLRFMTHVVFPTGMTPHKPQVFGFTLSSYQPSLCKGLFLLLQVILLQKNGCNILSNAYV